MNILSEKDLQDNFVKWIDDYRRKNDLKTVEFAKVAGIDATSISRYAINQLPLFETIVQFGLSLELDRETFWRELFSGLNIGFDVSWQRFKVGQEGADQLSRKDLVCFANLCLKEEMRAFRLLGKYLANVTTFIEKNPYLDMEEEEGFLANFYFLFLQRLMPHYGHIEFHVNLDVVPLLEDIDWIHNEGAYLSLTDAGQYVRASREKLGMKLRTLAKKIEVSPSVLSRIENGQTQRIRFLDVIRIAQILKAGEIIPIYWHVFEDHRYVMQNTNLDLSMYSDILDLFLKCFRTPQYFEYREDYQEMIQKHIFMLREATGTL